MKTHSKQVQRTVWMRRIAALTCAIAAALPATAALDPSTPTFEVFPADVNLKYLRDRQSMVVRITEPNGVHRDVTAQAAFTLADPTKAKIEKGVVFPVADGETTLKVEFQGKSL